MDDEKPRDDEQGNEPEEEMYDLQDEEEDAAARRQRLNADFLLDKVIPDEIDWRDLVRRHPMLSVGVAAGLGFLIGRSKGAAIVAGASAALTTAVMRQLSDVLDGEVFEF
jgi:ElaB/YqjD/DUF883 family membrane-anchored ribosome-binding protein